jgi:hypothetical protein
MFMTLEERIESFAILGEALRNAVKDFDPSLTASGSQLDSLIRNQSAHNPWFTAENVRMAITNIANELTEENLIKWTGEYPGLNENKNPFRVGIIMAGNIPLVGFHDFLSVLISGNTLLAKTSSKDQELIIHIGDILCSINPGFNSRIEFTSGSLTNFDAIIATGSDNSSRYFEYYFGRYPGIIRKNRNSIAIIEGKETEEELKRLGTDVLSYFGLGCRNVSKVYLPAGFDPMELTRNWESHNGMVKHTKYANNYDFNKAVYIVNREPFLDTGYLLLKEDKRISSPVSVLFYEFYESPDTVKQLAELNKEKIQCIAGRQYIPFGEAQCPHLWDYADGIDILDFLLKKNIAGIL